MTMTKTMYVDGGRAEFKFNSHASHKSSFLLTKTIFEGGTQHCGHEI